ncbi:MAG: hypothetical protein C0404_13475, partial [Verrucomicrobia bacterium]|nr:hypothetical protein [Verrucomicrobiota bacterium]
MGLQKKIFISGATGFIGRNLREQLQGDFSISAPSRAELDLLEAGAVYDHLRRNTFDVVIHCATWNATRNSTKDLSKVA